MTTRRNFLRGIGGAVIGLPLLPSLRARAQGAAPKRLVFMYAPNGVPVQTWWPTPGASVRDFTLNEVHASLERYKGEISFVGGLDMAALGPGGPHARGMGTALTGVELQSGTMPSNNGQLAGWANGSSLDQHLVQRLEPGTPFPSLQLGVRADNFRSTNMSRLSYAGPGQPLSPISEPRTLWQTLFPGAALRPEDETLQLRVMDAVRAQFSALRRQVPSDEREVLDQHQARVVELQSRLAQQTGGSGNGCAAPTEPMVADVNGDDEPDADNDATMRRVAELQIDMLATALACDLTRIATFQFSNAWARVSYPWVGRLATNHDISHTGLNDQISQEAWTDIATYQAELLARLVDALKAIPEGDGTVFDNTLIVWLSEIAVGNTHTHTNMPYLLAGDLGGTIRKGEFNSFSGRYHNDLLVTLMNAMGVDGDRFGNPELCQGPLSILN
ncbi:MAG: DUF1552 domain-containing protein [Myxococcota bacterium]